MEPDQKQTPASTSILASDTRAMLQYLVRQIEHLLGPLSAEQVAVLAKELRDDLAGHAFSSAQQDGVRQMVSDRAHLGPSAAKNLVADILNISRQSVYKILDKVIPGRR